MSKLEDMQPKEKALYKEGFFSGDYNQDLVLKRAVAGEKELPKYYICAMSNINGVMTIQGYIYFYMDLENKKSYFIGVKVQEEYRNLNIGSFLVASWIDLCFNYGYEFLGVNQKQRKPFLLYLLKTYGFEIFDKSLYQKRKDVIAICRSMDELDHNKYLLFKDAQHEKNFRGTNVYKTDNYQILDSLGDKVILDEVLLPLQHMSRIGVPYELRDYDQAEEKTEKTINNHRR